MFSYFFKHKTGRRWLYQEVATHVAAQFFAWVVSSVCLVLFSVAFTSYVAPQAIGEFKK